MKKMLLALPFALLAAGNALAADPIEKQVTVTALIPTSAFYVEPVGSWMNDPQDLGYSSISQDFAGISKQLAVKNTTGGIKAYLTSPAVITSGSERIELSVAVNGNALKLMSSDEVVPENVAKPGATVSFDIAAIKPSTGYVAGNYQGLVNMMFEAGTP